MEPPKIDYNAIREQLKPFGNVRECEERNDEFHLRIVGHKNTADNTLKILRIITDSGALLNFPIIKKAHIDEDIFYIVTRLPENWRGPNAPGNNNSTTNQNV